MAHETNGTHNGHSPVNAAGFEALLQKHERAVIRLAWGVLRDRQAAEDVAQEALVRLWQEHRRQAVPDPCDGWLRKVVLNLSRDRLRREGVFRACGSVNENEPASDVPTAEASMETGEDARRIRAMIEALPPQQRRCILLVCGEGLSHDEAALLIDCSKSTVRNHLQAARKMLLKLE